MKNTYVCKMVHILWLNDTISNLDYDCSIIECTAMHYDVDGISMDDVYAIIDHMYDESPNRDKLVEYLPTLAEQLSTAIYNTGVKLKVNKAMYTKHGTLYITTEE